MTMPKLLKITPENAIEFEGTFKEITTKQLTLTNTSQSVIAFKIKTTTPKQYCVRPSVGYVDVGESKEISVMLQPLEHSNIENLKHKFQIQSLVVQDKNAVTADQVWKSCKPEDIMITKLLSVLKYRPENELEEMEQEKKINDKSDEGNFSDNVAVIGDENLQLTQITHENTMLKGEISNLKKMVFDYSLQLERLKNAESGSRGVADGDKEDENKDIRRRNYQGGSGDNAYNSNTTNNEILERLGIPLVVYLLVVFFLGLVMGKFFL